MMEKKVLILSDVHLYHDKAEKIISKEKPDEIIFLGDYFDQWDDTAGMIKDTADWFHWSINQSNRIHLTGNHDVAYRFPNVNLPCRSGFEQWKSFIINDIVKPNDWEKLKFFHVLDNSYLLSHGGVHPYWIDKEKYLAKEEVNITLDELVSKLKIDTEKCIKLLHNKTYNWVCVAGFSRNDSPHVGGLIWLDFNQEFIPIRGIHQVVGHTPSQKFVRWKIFRENDKNVSESVRTVEPFISNKSSYNVCFDSYPPLRWYGIYKNKQLVVNNG